MIFYLDVITISVYETDSYSKAFFQCKFRGIKCKFLAKYTNINHFFAFKALIKILAKPHIQKFLFWLPEEGVDKRSDWGTNGAVLSV